MLGKLEAVVGLLLGTLVIALPATVLGGTFHKQVRAVREPLESR
jgi:hypothetical protein